MSSREPRLGVDIGRVIIEGAQSLRGDTSFFEGDEAAMLATPEVEGAVPAIARLADLFGSQIWLVSTCGQFTQERTLRWLDAHRFHQRTGLSRNHVLFCRTRPEKRIYCEQLRLTHFVDDHPEVHEAIRGTVDFQYLFGVPSQPVPEFVIPAPTWPDAEALILASLAGCAAGDAADTGAGRAPCAAE